MLMQIHYVTMTAGIELMIMRYDLYLSGPMTGLPNKNIPAFMKAAISLRRKGYRVVNPAELDLGGPEQMRDRCLRRDIRDLVKCKAIATLPNWKKSRGANLEVG